MSNRGPSAPGGRSFDPTLNEPQNDLLFVPRKSSGLRTDPNASAHMSENFQLQEKGGRSSPLGIALLDTSVSRHVGNVPKRVFPGSQQNASKGDRGGNHHDSDQNSQRTLSEKKKTKKPIPPPLSLGDNISPFDREVPFILSMSPRSTFGTPNSFKTEPRAKLEVSPPKEAPPTPTIVITPSEDSHAKSYIATTGSISRRLRQPSSVYSQAISPSMMNRSAPTKPPPIPRNYLYPEPTMLGQHKELNLPTAKSPDRHESTYTTFEEEQDDEDYHGEVNEETPLTAEARANRFSIETILPTPRRSKGWWNVFSTPILGRFSTGSGTRSVSFAENSPEISRKQRSPSSTISRDREIGPYSPQVAVSSPESFRQQQHPTTLEPVGEAAEYYDPEKSFESPVIPVERGGQAASAPTMTLGPSETHSVADSNNMRWPGFRGDDEDSIKSPISPQITKKHIKHFETHEVHTRHITHKTTEDDIMSPLSPSPVIGVASLGHFQPARQIDAKSPSMHSRNQSSPPQPTLLPPVSFVEKPQVQTQESPAFSKNGVPDVPNPFYNAPHGVARQLHQVSPTQSTPGQRKHAPPPLIIPNFDDPPVFPPPPKEAFEESSQKATTGIANEKPRRRSRRRTIMNMERPLPGFLQRMDKGGRWILGIMVLAIAVFITLVLVVVLSKTKHTEDKMPVQASWISVADLPPIPTGISTVAKTNIIAPVSGCVKPSEMWSCRPSDNNTEPNFRIEVRLNVGTTVGNANTTLVQQGSRKKRDCRFTSPTVLAAHLVKRARQLVSRDELSSAYFTPNPAPPALDEQQFLGKTTDGIRGAVQGELTPFYVSFLPTTTVPLPTRRLKSRQDSAVTTSSLPATTPSSTTSPQQPNPYMNLTNLIPAPLTLQNGSAQEPTLFPFPHAQPLRLYDRGLDTEHYGFYTYYDRSILVRLPSNTSDSTAISNAPLGIANALCTFSQTRFRVQIFTKQRQASLLPPPPNTPSLNSTLQLSNGTNSANDFVRPGSFPLPVSIVLDRHGGDPGKKAVYCYQVSDAGIVDTETRLVWPEDRGFGGTLVAGAGSPFAQDAHVAVSDGGVGGIDGGNGGCGCSYSNFHV